MLVASGSVAKPAWRRTTLLAWNLGGEGQSLLYILRNSSRLEVYRWRQPIAFFL
jgi:hypothetical protein